MCFGCSKELSHWEHYFFNHQYKHVFLVLKRTVSSRALFSYMCFGCSKELSHWEHYFFNHQYKHVFWVLKRTVSSRALFFTCVLGAQKNCLIGSIIFLTISINMCFGCSKELSHWEHYFLKYQYKHVFWVLKRTVSSRALFSYMCFVCSKEPSHQDGSFKYPQHMLWSRNKKNNATPESYIGAWYGIMF